jgi:acetyltransferase-like isoleucine patch superfamily enzyme
MISYALAVLRRLQTRLLLAGKGDFLTAGEGLHVGRGTRLWAPVRLTIGRCVYIGKQVHIEANADIGDYCLIANRVAFVGRHDHDFSHIGFPVRFAPWVGSKKFPSDQLFDKVIVEDDVWLGYGVTVLTGVTIGRGCIVAAGSVVSRSLPPYSICAGIPAKPIKERFPNAGDRTRHEHMIRNGRFEFSELGYDQCIVEPLDTAEENLK